MKYKVAIGLGVKWSDAMDWCVNSFGGEEEYGKRWVVRPSTKQFVPLVDFYFKNEEDAMLFSLMWL